MDVHQQSRSFIHKSISETRYITQTTRSVTAATCSIAIAPTVVQPLLMMMTTIPRIVSSPRHSIITVYVHNNANLHFLYTRRRRHFGRPTHMTLLSLLLLAGGLGPNNPISPVITRRLWTMGPPPGSEWLIIFIVHSWGSLLYCSTRATTAAEWSQESTTISLLRLPEQ